MGSRWLQPDALLWEGRLVRDVALAIAPDGTCESAGLPPPDARLELLPGKLLLPGLVNAHSHAFQRLLRGRTQTAAPDKDRDDFWTWRETMYRAAVALDPDGLAVASRHCFLEMARTGITTVGEFHYLHHAPDGRPYADPLELALRVIAAAREVGLRIHLLRVGYARPGFNTLPQPRQRRFYDPDPERFLGAVAALQERVRPDPLVTVGAAPHSVRAVPRSWLEAVARARPGTVHMHVAEQPREVESCLAEHGSPPRRAPPRDRPPRRRLHRGPRGAPRPARDPAPRPLEGLRLSPHRARSRRRHPPGRCTRGRRCHALHRHRRAERDRSPGASSAPSRATSASSTAAAWSFLRRARVPTRSPAPCSRSARTAVLAAWGWTWAGSPRVVRRISARWTCATRRCWALPTTASSPRWSSRRPPPR